ncbi:MAG: DUF1538 domain-containing protein [Thioalkalivibrionaceae bacterium]
MIFGGALWHAARNLAPILVVVVFFQALILQQVPEGALAMVAGLVVVVFGIALFLQGLDLGIFPIGRNLANQFARRGSLPLLMTFGFSLGFATVIAEPALIAVAEQAAIVSDGRIDALTLRLIVAFSVGFVVMLGVLRTVLGHPLQGYMIAGYLTVIAVTFFAPEEIVGLAYDSGGVTTNIVTVPLVAALGMGLASSLKGRNVLSDGFGLIALAVMVPMITVQLYGIVVYAGWGAPAQTDETEDAAAVDALNTSAQGPGVVDLVDSAATAPWWLETLQGLAGMLLDVVPILIVVVVFQYFVLRRPIAHLPKVLFGFVMVLFGLYAFVVGLKLGLFPIGEAMAEQLISGNLWLWLYVFAFAIGFATTMAEPALIAIGERAAEAAGGRLNGATIRLLVAFGVAIGITIGVHRIVAGDSIHYYIMGGYAIVIVLTLLAPRYIVALAFDLGGVTTSEVTVPLVTALGIGLATQIPGRDPLIDGFGLIAFASIFPIVTVLSYAIIIEARTRWRERASPEK